MKLLAACTLWLLLVVSSLVVGLTAVHYLRKEEARLAELERQTIGQRLDAVATDVELVLAEIKLGLENGLKTLPANDRDAAAEWVHTNPYATAAFMVDSDGELSIAGNDDPATRQMLRQNFAQARQERGDKDGYSQQDPQLKGEMPAASPPPPPPELESVQQRRKIREAQQTANIASISRSLSNYAADELEEAVADEAIHEPAAPAQSSGQRSPAGSPAPAAQQWQPVDAPTGSRQDEARTAARASARQVLDALIVANAEIEAPVHWQWLGSSLACTQTLGSGSRERMRGVVADMAAVNHQLQQSLPSSEPAFALQGPGITSGTNGGNGIRSDLADTYPELTRAIPSYPGLLLQYTPGPPSLRNGRLGFLGTLTIGLLTAATLLASTLLLLHTLASMRQARQRTGFVSTVSHEFKTPLTTIQMYAEMLREGRVANPERRQAYLATIENEVGRLTRMIGNVLSFSRMERGAGIAYHMETIDLRALLETLAAEQAPRLEQAGMSLDLSLPDAAAFVHGDRDTLRQVVLNLADNAIRYASSGEFLGIRLETAGGIARIRVWDHGPGIPARRRKRIFRPFHATDRAITDTKSGCGLGLSISRRIAADHGGSLDLCPGHSTGACFELTLPQQAFS